MQVVPVSDRRALKQFIEFPYLLYKSDPHWIPPLRLEQRARFDRARDPFYQHADAEFFIALEGSTVVGRVAALDDHLHNQVHRDNLATFGYFEARNADVAAALLATVEAWARRRGRAALRGPLNPSLHDSAGLLVEGFDAPPAMMMPHNPPGYAQYIEGAGFQKVKDLLAWLYDLELPLPPYISELAARVRARQRLTIRTAQRARFNEELDQFQRIYTEAWKDTWGFVLPTRQEATHFAMQMKHVFDPSLAIFVEMDGEPVACVLAIPDINQALRGTKGRLFPTGWWRLLNRRRHMDQARLVLLGVMPEYRHLGLYPVLLDEISKRRGPYRYAELSWILEDNRNILNAVTRAGAVHYKTYRVYQKALT